MQPLFYRPNEFDDWGQIRNADGSMFASVRRPLSEEEADDHRRNKTDPFEDLARRLIASFSRAPGARDWAVWWQGSGPERGDHIMRKDACGLGYADEVAYIGDQHHDAAHAIVDSHNAEIASLRSQSADAQATAQAWWYEDSTGCFHMSLDMDAGERRKRELGVALNYLYGAPIEHQPAAWRDVLAERRRQIEAEAFDASHDDMATQGQLAGAAACYALTAAGHWAANQGVDTFWPWDKQWWKPTDKRRNLIKAAALLLAEIERLDRIDNGTSITLQAIIDKTVAHIAAMSPEEREAMLAAQRESFVRGMSTPCEHGQLDFETCPACRAASKEGKP